MKVGRALDVAVATEVFLRTSPRWIWAVTWRPRYSTDLRAAFELVAEIEARGYWLRLVSPFQPGQPWWAGFTPLGVTGWNGRPDYEASGPTPMVAICRAALLTVSGEAAQVAAEHREAAAEGSKGPPKPAPKMDV